MSASFKAVSSTREEYLAVIDNLKSTAPEIKKGQKRTKTDAAHLDLIQSLQDRIEQIDHELAVCLSISIVTRITWCPVTVSFVNQLDFRPPIFFMSACTHSPAEFILSMTDAIALLGRIAHVSLV